MSLKLPSCLLLGALLFSSKAVFADWSVDFSVGAANSGHSNFKSAKGITDVTIGYQFEDWRLFIGSTHLKEFELEDFATEASVAMRAHSLGAGYVIEYDFFNVNLSGGATYFQSEAKLADFTVEETNDTGAFADVSVLAPIGDNLSLKLSGKYTSEVSGANISQLTLGFRYDF